MKYVTPILAATTLVTGLLFGLPMNGFGQDSKTEQTIGSESKRPEQKNGIAGFRASASVHSSQAWSSRGTRRRRYTRLPA